MSLDLSFRGRRVLLAGLDPRSSATIEALLRDGAVVTIAPRANEPVPTSVRDLAQRRLVTIDAAADPAVHDVVVRAMVQVTDATSGSAEDAASAVGSHPTTHPHATVPLPGEGGGAPVGTVTLIGGGPGDPGLITVAGLAAIAAADVIVHDRLAPLSTLSHARADAVVVDVGKIPRGEFTPQERINAVLVEHALAGRQVARLKGGDNFVFGRGGEEAEACVAAGVPVVVVPGVTSSVAGPALAGIPLTHRTLVQGFTVVSGHVPPSDPRSTLDWGALARTNTTIVVLMGVATLPAIADELVAQGLSGDTPAAVVADAALPSMRTVRAPLREIAHASARAGLGAPAVVVIGAVAALDVGA